MYFGTEYLSQFYYGTDDVDAAYGNLFGLVAYQNQPDSVVLYWSFAPYTSDISNVQWTVQTDLVETFDSTDLRTYTAGPTGTTGPTGSTGDIEPTFIDGCIHKGIAISIYPKAQGANLNMYWRVKGTYGGEDSPWAISRFIEPAAIDDGVRDFTLSFLPDVLYNKESTSNIYKIHDACADEFEEVNKELNLVNNDLYTISVRDASIADNFGELVGISKPYVMVAVDYREIIRNFMASIRMAPSRKAVGDLIKSIYGKYPTFVDISDEFDMYVGSDSISDPDYVEPFYLEDLNSDPVIPAATVWDIRHMSYGTIIDIDNEFDVDSNAIITKEYVSGIVNKMIPAHAPVYLEYI